VIAVPRIVASVDNPVEAVLDGFAEAEKLVHSNRPTRHSS